MVAQHRQYLAGAVHHGHGDGMPALPGLMHDHFDHGLGLFARQDRLTHDGARGLVFQCRSHDRHPSKQRTCQQYKKKTFEHDSPAFFHHIQEGRGTSKRPLPPFPFWRRPVTRLPVSNL